MIILLIFSFIAGVITILSPCILPILPIILSGSLGSHRKPLGIVTGFILSFTIFTLFLSAIVNATGIPSDTLRSLSIIIIFLFGISLVLPQFQIIMEKLFSKVSGKFATNTTNQGYFGGVFLGLSLGLVWTPCVGPIIASVITLAATSSVNFAAFFITFAYALGTAIPMLLIMLGGRTMLNKIPWLIPNSSKIQKFFGVIMILTAIGIYFNIDRRFQNYILDKFPSYGTGLIKLEDNKSVRENLENTFNSKQGVSNINSSSLLNNYGMAEELVPGGAWFNSEPFTLESKKGKVILIDFWTYTCINCIRTLPYLKDWDKKYKDQGLVIIGVHSPEFEFEKNPNNLQKAITEYEIKYPVMQDNNFATWQAYNNRYWPAKYLIDSKGTIRYTHFGEGEYDKTERAIQELLKEAGKNVTTKIDKPSNNQNNSNITSETYLGSERMLYFFPNGKVSNGTQKFTIQKNIPLSKFTLGGEWIINDEYSESKNNAVLEYNFYAQDIYLVMRSKDGNPKKVKVKVDGKNVSSNSGSDTANGEVTITTDKLYQLVNLKDAENRLLRLEFEDGVEVFAFTFG